MKKFLVGLVLSLPLVAIAAIQGTPFKPEVDKRFHAIEAGTGDIGFTVGSPTGTWAITAGSVVESDVTAQNAEGLHIKRIARVTYDVAADGGTIAAHALGVSLPANAVITRSWLYIVTQFADAGSGTVALSCEDANNIKTATDITGSAAGAFIEGQSTGAASAFVGSIAAACEVTATVAGAAQSAGKLIAFIEYVVVE